MFATLRVKGRALYAVAPEALLSECVTTMADLDIGSLVVMDQGCLAGMLSCREVIRVLAKRQREHRVGPTPSMSEIRAHDVMEPKPRVATQDMDVNALRLMMLEHHDRYVPVIDGPLMPGMISFYDVARAVLDSQCFENRMLKAYIRDWPTEG
jgi:CBS domain-containing protein